MLRKNTRISNKSLLSRNPTCFQTEVLYLKQNLFRFTQSQAKSFSSRQRRKTHYLNKIRENTIQKKLNDNVNYNALPYSARFFSMSNRNLAKKVSGSNLGKHTPRPQLDLSTYTPEYTRNFSIIAHIDHGKSTLADRLLELTGLIERGKQSQFLDKLPVERERGITVKAQSVSMFRQHPPDSGTNYLLNLVDTPGHVDFAYEVSRSLAACQGALLLVDAAQGIEAQTLSNFYLALEEELAMIPVLTKIDQSLARPDEIAAEMEHAFGIDKSEIIQTSAKSGIGCEEVLSAIIDRIPGPRPSITDRSVRALIFDSWYDTYKGVICLIRVTDGVLRHGDRIQAHHSSRAYMVAEVGVMHPDATVTGALYAGQVGYVIAGMRSTKEARIGDTLFHEEHYTDVEPIASTSTSTEDHTHTHTHAGDTSAEYRPRDGLAPFPGFQTPQPVVFAGVYPVDNGDFDSLRDAVEKLLLTDSSIAVEKESSAALGMGFRCGFLGLLHMDVFTQRLEQEFGTSIIVTSPTVTYELRHADGTIYSIRNPKDWPSDTGARADIAETFEPVVEASILMPSKFLGALIQLCQEHRGEQVDISYQTRERVLLRYRLPLSEIVLDFYDKLKSITHGYASFDYEEVGLMKSNLTKLDILINKEPVDALSMIVHRSKAQDMGRTLCERLTKVIPRQLFEVALQAAVGGKIVARETLKAMRKDVTAKCYGGDVTRRRKLLSKQKEGKKRMKQIGTVNVPQEAFISVIGHSPSSKK